MTSPHNAFEIRRERFSSIREPIEGLIVYRKATIFLFELKYLNRLLIIIDSYYYMKCLIIFFINLKLKIFYVLYIIARNVTITENAVLIASLYALRVASNNL